jgi:hypothetical protein
MSVGVSDGFLQRGEERRIVILVAKTGIDSKLHDSKFFMRQLVHCAEDFLHRAHDSELTKQTIRKQIHKSQRSELRKARNRECTPISIVPIRDH